ncbi:MAG: hypothetical protein WA876_12830 [Candidatus Acidiferrales bacterium]
MATKIHDIDPGPGTPKIVRMIVEIPKNSRNKYRSQRDQKVLAVPSAVRRNPYGEAALSPLRREIEHFFTIYKELEHKEDENPGLEQHGGGAQDHYGQPETLPGRTG